jgi:hypothetical protein
MCILKALFFAFCASFGLISIRWNMKFGLVVGGQRGHRIRYARSKESDLHMNLGFYFIDICLMKALFFCI